MKPSTRSSNTLRDFVDVRSHPTVVRLDHLGGRDSQWITSAYHVTRDIENHLSSLRHALSRPNGCGMFLIGQYGAGKSHFLAYVTQNVRSGGLVEKEPEVVPVSLLNFRAATALEDVVGDALGLAPAKGDRREEWSRLSERHPGGVLLVIDELSEFLRSKGTRQAFNEDVRFLQFMGEWAQGNRFWVLAAMQEQIEHTGELERGMYRKIKDRYALRFLLGAAHVKDLLAQGILVKKEGYARRVEELARDMVDAFPSLSLNTADFCAIYPIHPATLELLEEVRDQFSQARGVVDFTVTQLAGDPSRRVRPFLDRPWGSLLTPDFIVDHFRDLFEVQPEFLPLGQQLLPYYRKHLSEIFPATALEELAQRVLKLLILSHLSPSREGLTAEEAACWLLYKATRIDPEKNLKIVERVLRELAERGRYVVERQGTYDLRLEDDGGAALERFLERTKAELRERGDVIFELLVPLLTGDFNPFSLPQDEWQPRKVSWYFHERRYSVYLGDEAPPPQKGLAFCLRLPWGEARATPGPAGLYTFQPAPIEVSDDLVELAAMAQAQRQPWVGGARTRLEARFKERAALFGAQVKNAYLNSEVTNPNGEAETPPRADPALSFDDWLGSCAVWLLKRSYPAFERFAPRHGPLPKEAFRAFMRFASSHDLGEYEADEYVKLIREAYLVPMKLLQRREHQYVLPRNPEKNELVSLVLPLLDVQPAPRVVHEHLANPVYGLVPDQVALLLIYLLVLGEIDILKERKSYRDFYETLPNPIQYDRIVPGCALGMEQLRDLEKLCDGLSIRPPKQWTVLAQRRAIDQLRDEARRQNSRLQPLLLKLRQSGQGDAIVERLRRVVSQWSALDKGDDEFEGLQQFFFEIGTVSRFLSTLAELRDLPERVDRLLGEMQRYRHLFSHPVLEKCAGPELARRLEALGPPPGLDRPDVLDSWLERSRELYGQYKESYRRQHDAWWQTCSSHPIWRWEPPPLARSRHVGLGEDLKALRTARDRATQLRCRGLVDLEFQPVCTCNFDGERSPIEEQLRRFESLEPEIERGLTLFFQQEEVKSCLRKWVKEGLEVNPRTLAYLDGREPTPEIHDLELFDRHLAGVETVKDVEPSVVLELLGERTWERRSLLKALELLLGRIGADRFRFATSISGRPSRVLRWCAEQVARSGVPLPRGLNVAELAEVAASMRPEWVSPVALQRLEDLGLDERTVGQIVAWLLEGRIQAPSRSAASPLVSAALEVMQPTHPETSEDLASLSEKLYGQHPRLSGIAGEPWLERLDRLAQTSPRTAAGDLTETLTRRAEDQWLILDCLGLPLLGSLRAHVDSLFPLWRLEEVEFAMVSKETTTEACYRQLIEAGIRHPLEKINCVDSILHERFLPFVDLHHLVVAELRIACNKLEKRLDAGRPLVIFADHGFRLARDGNSYQHGGASVLERTVPVLRLVPRS